MIELTIPVEQIPYVRTIEGRKFANGKWLFPDSARDKLLSYGFIQPTEQPNATEFTYYPVSEHLYKYQRDIVNKALNAGSFGIFADTGTGKTIIGLEIAKHYNKTLDSIQCR